MTKHILGLIVSMNGNSNGYDDSYSKSIGNNVRKEARRKQIWNHFPLIFVLSLPIFKVVSSFTFIHNHQHRPHNHQQHQQPQRISSTAAMNHCRSTGYHFRSRASCVSLILSSSRSSSNGSRNSSSSNSNDKENSKQKESPLRIEHRAKDQTIRKGRKDTSHIHMVMAIPDATDSETTRKSTTSSLPNFSKEKEGKYSAKTNDSPTTQNKTYSNEKSSQAQSDYTLTPKSSVSKSSSSNSKDRNTQLKSSTKKMKIVENKINQKQSSSSPIITNNNENNRKKRRKKYQRKRPKTQSEKDRDILKRKRQKEYERIMSKSKNDLGQSNLWAFESLFPAPGWDEETIHRDLYEVAERDASITESNNNKNSAVESISEESGNKLSMPVDSARSILPLPTPQVDDVLSKTSREIIGQPSLSRQGGNNTVASGGINANSNNNSTKIDRSLTRMVEDRLYGFRRGQMGEFEYDTSLMGDGAVKFRDGIRLGNALKVNADRLTYFAKREMIHGKLEEAEELYEMAIQVSPQDGRAYLGLAKIAERRRDFKAARDCLRAGIAKSRCEDSNGGNPFLLQALGNLEEKAGHLSEAEKLYIDAAKSRPSHAAAWVALAQLRTRKLRQGPSAGRICYQTAERELKRAGLSQSSYVYTAWAGLECKAGNNRKARDLFQKALEIDPKCSAAWLQLGVLEANEENWDKAKECFETVLKFDKRNSRVLQAYALMETKRPDGNSREAIGLFEKAILANPRDGGVLQAYGLYVAKLGDIDSARDLLRRGTEIDKRHAPLWQAWGVLETRHGTASDAREIFQQGIWACAQPSGGQSGGRRCARLWQAWGVLEAQEGDHAAARRCFSRALDADNRNVAAITAWTLMEQELGQFNDAKLIFERSLRQFTSSSDEKLAIWRAYELMEVEAGNLKAAQNVYQRSIRDTMRGTKLESSINYESKNLQDQEIETPKEEVLKKSSEVEVSRWNIREGFGESDVWMKDGSIEGKVPSSAMKKGKKPRQ